MGNKITSCADLKALKTKAIADIELRNGKKDMRITVHMGTCGIAAGARSVMTALMDEISAGGLSDIIVTTSGCAGLCAREPLATVEIMNQPPVKYCDLNEEKMKTIFREHIIGGTPVEKFALVIGSETTY